MVERVFLSRMRDAVDIDAAMAPTTGRDTGAVSVPVAWATFGGSTCLLFLLCYVCQRKLQENDSGTATTRQVYVISCVSQRGQSEEESRHAPPTYESALCQKRIQTEDPPTYEAATRSSALTL